MSFDLICSNCGAASGPSTGVCPFCKNVMVAASKNADPSLAAMKKAYAAGDIAKALSFATLLTHEKPKLLQNRGFVFFYIKILFESEGPTSLIRNLLMKLLVEDPEDVEGLDYMELIEAKSYLSREQNDLGEQKLLALIRRAPGNVHALFALGSHLFWSDGKASQAIRYLEEAVKYHPKFLRALGCLAAIYESLGQTALSQKTYRRCAAVETEPKMKKLFMDKAKGL